MHDQLIDPQSLSDLELIKRVRHHNDNDAFAELRERHSGIYMSVVNRYSGFSDKIIPAELKDDKSYNIYKWLIAYDETRGMKFGTFVGERIKYECLNILSKTPDKVEMTEVNEPAAIEAPQPIADDTLAGLEARARRVPHTLFWPIFKARHLSEPKATWREIGVDLGVTHEWARQIYKAYIPAMREETRL